MRERYFLQIDGIPGESSDADHPGEIDIVSWTWGVTASAPASGSGGGGGGSGKAQFADFEFVAQMSVASPKLVEAAVTGRHHRTAVLTGAKAPGKARLQPFLRYALSDVTVAAVHHEDTTAMPTERFALRYAKFEIFLTPATGAPTSFGFDVKANKPL